MSQITFSTKYLIGYSMKSFLVLIIFFLAGVDAFAQSAKHPQQPARPELDFSLTTAVHTTSSVSDPSLSQYSSFGFPDLGLISASLSVPSSFYRNLYYVLDCTYVVNGGGTYASSAFFEGAQSKLEGGGIFVGARIDECFFASQPFSIGICADVMGGYFSVIQEVQFYPSPMYSRTGTLSTVGASTEAGIFMNIYGVVLRPSYGKIYGADWTSNYITMDGFKMTIGLAL